MIASAFQKRQMRKNQMASIRLTQRNTPEVKSDFRSQVLVLLSFVSAVIGVYLGSWLLYTAVWFFAG